MTRRNDPEPDSTRQRLLEAAGETFADHGFAASTIQMISQRAGANIASVNYYFGSKEKLYHEVLTFGRRVSGEADQPLVTAPVGENPRVTLRRFIRRYLDCLLSPDRPEWYNKLVAREIAEPSVALDELIEIKIQPIRQHLASIVTEMHGGHVDAKMLQQVMESVVGQCLFYYRCRHVVLRLRGLAQYDEATIDEIAENLSAFSIGGITALLQLDLPTLRAKN